MARRFMVLALFVAAVTTAAGGGACFSPRQPACAFSCAEAGVCPEGYACAGDGFCHRSGAPMTACDVSSDGGQTGPDAGVDADAAQTP